MSRWRVGGKVPLNVYEGDRPMFQCHTPEDAERVVALLNEAFEYRNMLRCTSGHVHNGEYGDGCPACLLSSERERCAKIIDSYRESVELNGGQSDFEAGLITACKSTAKLIKDAK